MNQEEIAKRNKFRDFIWSGGMWDANGELKRFTWHPEMNMWEWRFHMDTQHPKRRFISSEFKRQLEETEDPQLDLGLPVR